MYKYITYKIVLFSVASILFGNFSYGQLGFCSGNSGDPIFSETFGTGTTNGPPLAPGTTTYNYINGAPQDGQYTVANNTGYFDWFAVPDHTPGDTNGKCLIVNASFTPGEFYRRTVTGLCGSTSYEFSSWLINLLPQSGCGNAGNPVNVSFEIWDSSDTNLLASGDTGNIFGTVTPDWNQYALVFQTLNNQTSVILKMINNGIGGCGNDLAIDDIVFKTCGDFISVEDNLTNTSVSICISETPYSSLLEAIPDNSVFDSYAYQWQQSTDGTNWTDISGETNVTYQVNGVTTTTYFRVKVAESSINLANNSCNTISEEYAIIVIPDFSPPTSDGDVLFNCSINQAVLIVSVPDGFTVNWYNAPINGTLLESNNPTYFTSTETGTFYAETVNVTTGCVSQIRTPVSVSRVDPNPPISDGDVLFNCINGEAVLSVSVPSGVSVDWFDAPSGGTLLQLDSETYNTISQTGTFYAQAEDETTGCISLTRTPISVTTELPDTPISSGDVQFDCTLDEAILSVSVPSGVSANWYDSNGNLLLSGSTSYTATALGSFYAESILLSNGCTSLNLVQIDVFSINPDPPISNGDVEVSCNTATGVLTVTVPAGILVDWYDSPAGGALLETNSTTYTTNIPGTYYAEAIDGTTNCKSITRTAVSLFAGNEFPNVEDEFLTFCEDDTIVLDAGISDVTYLWSTGETTREIVVNQPGTYTVIVTNSSNCSSTKTIELIQIDKPVIESINSDGYELEILTTEQGDFQYSLDDVFYQTSNVFNVEGGLYNVFVQGRDGCGKVSMEYIHFVIPKFFTPNNDGTNDNFDLKGIEYYSSSSVYIFDRYGKLLKSAKNQPFSWNGTYNSENLPSDDYWYNITIENQIFRGHFTLKR